MHEKFVECFIYDIGANLTVLQPVSGTHAHTHTSSQVVGILICATTGRMRNTHLLAPRPDATQGNSERFFSVLCLM